MYRIIFLGLIAVSFCLQSCSWGKPPYDIDKVLPNGKYRVKIRVTPGERGKSRDQAKFQFFQGEEIVDKWDWEQEDHYEAGFDSLLPIEWVDNNVLHVGAERPKEDFSDQLTVVNSTDENLKYVGISYSRYESFKLFDLAPGMRITVHANPQFTPKGTHNNSFGYGGMT